MTFTYLVHLEIVTVQGRVILKHLSASADILEVGQGDIFSRKIGVIIKEKSMDQKPYFHFPQGGGILRFKRGIKCLNLIVTY